MEQGITGRPPKASNVDIVRAAWALFEEVGFEAASMSTIADRAGISRRTLFNHFPHKVALLFPPADEYLAAFREELRRQPLETPVLSALAETFWRLAPLTAELEARDAAGQEVTAARAREDAVTYWQQVWASAMETMVLERLGPGEQRKARMVGAITAQIWTEFSILRSDANSPISAEAAMGRVIDDVAQLLGVGLRVQSS